MRTSLSLVCVCVCVGVCMNLIQFLCVCFFLFKSRPSRQKFMPLKQDYSNVLFRIVWKITITHRNVNSFTFFSEACLWPNNWILNWSATTTFLTFNKEYNFLSGFFFRSSIHRVYILRIFAHIEPFRSLTKICFCIHIVNGAHLCYFSYSLNLGVMLNSYHHNLLEWAIK